MKLLLDEHLSRRILPFLASDYPGSAQVAALGLERADDRTLWAYAAAQGYVMVTRDADFVLLSDAIGPPPRVIWLRFGNCSNARVIHELTSRRPEIEAAFADGQVTMLEIR